MHVQFDYFVKACRWSFLLVGHDSEPSQVYKVPATSKSGSLLYFSTTVALECSNQIGELQLNNENKYLNTIVSPS